jgi:hypothetical protein
MQYIAALSACNVLLYRNIITCFSKLSMECFKSIYEMRISYDENMNQVTNDFFTYTFKIIFY